MILVARLRQALARIWAACGDFKRFQPRLQVGSEGVSVCVCVCLCACVCVCTCAICT